MHEYWTTKISRVEANTMSGSARHLTMAPGYSVACHNDEPRAQSRRPPKIYVVTDVLLYREGLSSHLQKDDRIDFVGAGPPSEATLVKLKQLSPDAVVIDLAMRDSIGFVQHIRDRVTCA